MNSNIALLYPLYILSVYAGGRRGSWWCLIVSMTWVCRCQSPCQVLGGVCQCCQCQYCTWFPDSYCAPVCFTCFYDHENVLNFPCVGQFRVHLHTFLLFCILKCIIMKLMCHDAIKRKLISPSIFTLCMYRLVVSTAFACYKTVLSSFVLYAVDVYKFFLIFSYSTMNWMFSSFSLATN